MARSYFVVIEFALPVSKAGAATKQRLLVASHVPVVPANYRSNATATTSTWAKYDSILNVSMRLSNYAWCHLMIFFLSYRHSYVTFLSVLIDDTRPTLQYMKDAPSHAHRNARNRRASFWAQSAEGSCGTPVDQRRPRQASIAYATLLRLASIKASLGAAGHAERGTYWVALFQLDYWRAPHGPAFDTLLSAAASAS